MQTEPTKVELPKGKRRWFQFSLRTLMIGVAVWTGVCSLVPAIVREIRAARCRQTMQVTPFEAAGGPASAGKLKNARPLTNEEIQRLIFPPPEKESWFFELFR
jgi:hypothetical protein